MCLWLGSIRIRSLHWRAQPRRQGWGVRRLMQALFEADSMTGEAEGWAVLRRLWIGALEDTGTGRPEEKKSMSRNVTRNREDQVQRNLAKRKCRRPRQSGSKQCRKAFRSTILLDQCSTNSAEKVACMGNDLHTSAGVTGKESLVRARTSEIEVGV